MDLVAVEERRRRRRVVAFGAAKGAANGETVQVRRERDGGGEKEEAMQRGPLATRSIVLDHSKEEKNSELVLFSFFFSTFARHFPFELLTEASQKEVKTTSILLLLLPLSLAAPGLSQRSLLTGTARERKP